MNKSFYITVAAIVIIVVTATASTTAVILLSKKCPVQTSEKAVASPVETVQPEKHNDNKGWTASVPCLISPFLPDDIIEDNIIGYWTKSCSPVKGSVGCMTSSIKINSDGTYESLDPVEWGKWKKTQGKWARKYTAVWMENEKEWKVSDMITFQFEGGKWDFEIKNGVMLMYDEDEGGYSEGGGYEYMGKKD